MSSWKNYVAACLRIADLVESRREPGTAPNFNKTAEGRNDALWLTVGIYILEFLSEKAEDVGAEYVSIMPAVEALLRQYPLLNDDDIQFVCRLLSCETVFHYSDGEKVFPVGKTALIEQLSSSRHYRLTQTGRLATDIANKSSEMIYSDDDTRKILKAIEVGDFGRAMKLCKEIRKQLVMFSHELRRAQERPGGSDFLEDFTRHRELFEKVVTNAHETVTLGLDRLKEPGMAEKVDEWGELHDEFLTAPQIRRALKELAAILERLARSFAQIIYEFADSSRQKGLILDFRALSGALVASPPSETKLRNFFKAIGPSRTSFTYAIPEDFRGYVRTYAIEENEMAQEFSEGVEVTDPPRWFSDLLKHHREEILSELNTNGYVTLKTGIVKGWFRHNDIEMLSSLTGIYRCPEGFDLPNKSLSVGIGREFKTQAGNCLFSGNDIALVLSGGT